MAATEREVAEAMAKSLGVTLAEEKEDTIIDTTDNTDGTLDGENKAGEGELKDTSSQAAAGDDASAAAKLEKKLPTDTTDKSKLDQSTDKSKNSDGTDKTLESKAADLFANEQVAKLNEYVKNGGDIDDFIRTQRTDYSKIPDLEALRHAERLNDSTLTDEDITLLLEDKYGVTENATDKEKRLNDLKIKRDATIAKQALIENQKKWAVAPNEKNADEIAAAGLKWKSTLDNTTDSVEKLDIKLNETETFTYTVPVDVKGKVKEENATLSTFFKRYLNEDGSENVEKFVKDMIILKNFNEIVMAAAGFNKSKGKEEVIKDIKNTDFQSKDKNTGSSTAKTIAQQAAEQVFGKR